MLATLSHEIIESAIQASNLVLQLKDSFESLSLLQHSSMISTQHLAVGASVGGAINIGAFSYNFGWMILLGIQYVFLVYSLSGLFSIPITFILMYCIYFYALKLFTFDA